MAGEDIMATAADHLKRFGVFGWRLRLTTSTKNLPDAVTAFAGTPTTATSMFAAVAPANGSWPL